MDDFDNTPNGGEGDALSFEDKLDATLGAAFDAANEEPQNRDATTGRFASKNPPEEEPASAAPSEPAAEENTGEQEAPAGSETITRAPASWSPAAKAAFDAADPVIQQEVLKREGDINKALQTHATERKEFAPIQQILGSRASTLIEDHGSVAQGITDLFKISDFAAESPEEFIQWFAQNRGVDLAKFAGQPAGETNPVINSLMQKIHALESVVTSAQRQQVEHQQTAANRQVEAFAANHPHFEAVRGRMGQLIQSGLAETLDDAYDMAVHMDPAIRNQLIEDQKKAAADELAKRNAEAAARARNAAGTNLKPTGAPSQTKAGKRSIEETLAAAYDRATG